MAKAKKDKAAKTKVLDATQKQVHGALESRPSVNMIKLFGINDGYDNVDNIDQYRAKLQAMTVTDLHEHSHRVGIVPLDARDKLITSLEKKFLEAKMRQLPNRALKLPTRADSDPEMANFMKKFQAGEL